MTKKISRQRAVSRQVEYQRRQVAKGLCRKCARPRVNANHCKIHRAYMSAYQREYMKRRRAQVKKD